jgi:hypothetical protein
MVVALGAGGCHWLLPFPGTSKSDTRLVDGRAGEVGAGDLLRADGGLPGDRALREAGIICTPGSWSTAATVTSDVYSTRSVLALDVDGVPYAVFFSSTQLVHSWPSGGKWGTSTLLNSSPDNSSWVASTIDGDNVLRAAATSSIAPPQYLSTNLSTGETPNTPLPKTLTPQAWLALTLLDKVTVMVTAGVASSSLQVIHNVSGSFTATDATSIDGSVFEGIMPALLGDASGVHLVWYAQTGVLRYSLLDAALVGTIPVAIETQLEKPLSCTESTNGCGFAPALARDAASGAIHLAYSDLVTSELKLATCVKPSSCSWSVAGLGVVGTFPSIVVSPTGTIHVAFIDSSGAKVMLASDSTTTGTAPVAIAVGTKPLAFPSLAIHSDRQAHLTYQAGSTLWYTSNPCL